MLARISPSVGRHVHSMGVVAIQVGVHALSKVRLLHAASACAMRLWTVSPSFRSSLIAFLGIQFS